MAAEEEVFRIEAPTPEKAEPQSYKPYIPIKNPIGMIVGPMLDKAVGYGEKTEAPTPAPTPAAQSDVFRIQEGPVDLSLTDVAKQAAINFPSSAVGVAQSMIEPILHPIQTAEAIGQIGKGAYSKASGAFGATQDPAKKEADEAAFNAMRDYFSERYGSWAGFKQALAKDPAAVFADLSVPLTLGGGAAARAPGLIGKAGEITSKVGSAIDPVNLALKGTSAAVEGVAKYGAAPLMSLRSGASVRSLQQAVDAGATANPEFWKFYTKQGTPDQVIDAFSQAIRDVRDARNADYQASMQGIRANRTPLPFNNIDATINNQLKSITSSGKVFRENAQKALTEVAEAVNQWKSQPRIAGANSMADMDALKQRLSEIRDAYKSDPSAERVVTAVRKSVYETIAARDPNYARIMEEYTNATKKLNEIRSTIQTEKDISVGKKIRGLLKAQGSTAGSKVLDDLDKYNPSLKYMLAGMELSELMPYGNYRRTLLGTEGLGQFAGQAASSLAGLNPYYLMGHVASLPFASPAVSGATMGAVGAAAGAPKKAAEIYNKVPAMVRMPTYAVGRAAEEAAPEEEVGPRAGRASGGRITPASIGARLVAAAERAKKEINKSTEPLLQSDDESIAKALEIANKHI